MTTLLLALALTAPAGPMPPLTGQFLTGRKAVLPAAGHEHVITVYGGTAVWKQRLGCNSPKSACLALLDPQGNIRWAQQSLYDDAVWTNLQSQTAPLLNSHPQPPPIR